MSSCFLQILRDIYKKILNISRSKLVESLYKFNFYSQNIFKIHFGNLNVNHFLQFNLSIYKRLIS